MNQSERQDAIRSRLDALGACSYPDLAEWLGMPLESIPRLLAGCRAGGYAVGYFESWNLESLQGVLDAAEQTRSLVIVGFNGEFLSGTGRLVPERLALHGALGKAAAESSSVFACLERPMTARHLGIAEALREAIAEEMSRDQRVFCIGEDIAV
ncbi:MAG: class II fructose-bisphosphate aldolase, partial [Pirellulales bacterium]|nr:class II fructose-bisphosphate aldolase [Pirellulales bacterium]